MKKFYIMDCYKNISDYISILDNSFTPKFIKSCDNSEFQYLDKTPIDIEIEENGGVFPDFIYAEYNSIPLISMRLKNLFDAINVDNLFYKQINLVEKNLGLKEVYYLALPPKIDCLDNSKLELDFLDHAENIFIDESCTGNYQIFKLSGVNNNEIIVTDFLKQNVEKLNLEGILFIPTD